MPNQPPQPNDIMPSWTGGAALSGRSRPLVPDHELIRCVGRGGFGEVWLAKNAIGTCRAVKIVYRRTFKDDRPYEREFTGMKKFEPISRTHEGLVDILHVGRNDAHGYFYYVMELADDRVSGQEITPGIYEPKTLHDIVEGGHRLPVDECLQLAASLASAVGHLHRHGLIHRDIKPANIIFVNGIPKLADIGLVTDADTLSGLGGTAGYIAPEASPSPKADLYSLGKVLYEISTGLDRFKFPQVPTSWFDEAEPERLGELNEIFLKACEENPEKRYQSAEAILEDLLFVQSGKSVKRLRTLERRLALLTKVGAILLAGGLIAAAAYYQVSRAKQKTTQLLAGSYVAIGTRSMNQGDLLGSLPWFAQALSLRARDEARTETDRVRLAAVLRECPRIVGLHFHDGLLSQAHFSPDGRQVLIACADGQVRRWDTENKLRLPPLLGHTGEVQVATFSRDGRFILSASADETARLWDAVTGQQLFVLAHPNTVYGAQFNAAGDLVVTACGDGIARLWNVATGQMTDALLKCQGAALFDAAFSRDGRHLVIATAGDESMGQVWDLATRQPLGPPLKHDSWVYQARFSPDGRLVVTASFDTTARVWEVGTGRLVRTFKHRLPVKCAQFSPDGRYVLTASWDFVAQLWDVAKGEAVGPPLKHSSYLAHAAFSPDGRRVVTASVRGVTTLWDLAPNNWQAAAASSVLNRFGPEFTGGSASARETSAPPTSAESLPLNGASEALFQVKPNRAGDRLLVLSSRSPSTGTVQTVGQLWDALNWRSLASAFACSERMTNALLSENGQRLLEIVGQEVEVWDTVKGRALFSLPHTNPVSGGAFDVAARRILTWCGRDAQIWDASAGQARLHFPHVRSVKHAAFSPDGQQVVTTSGTNAHLWNALTGQPVHSLAHVTDVSHAAFSPDGRRLVTCCKDGTPAECAAYIWDVSTGRRIGEPLRHRDGVNFAIFSLDGQRLLTTSEDSTAQVWDAATGRPLTQPLVHGKTLNQACFSANGRWVATGSWDQTARIWDAETGEPLSPPLRHPWYVHFLQFTADGQRLVARRLLGDSRIWDLPRHPHAVEDLVLLSQLLSGHQIDTDGGALPLTRDALENIWRTLRARQPADVSVTSAETLAWHEHELERSEKARQWFAARFHLDWLLARQPNDALLLQRRARAEAQLGRPGAS